MSCNKAHRLPHSIGTLAAVVRVVRGENENMIAPLLRGLAANIAEQLGQAMVRGVQTGQRLPPPSRPSPKGGGLRPPALTPCREPIKAGAVALAFLRNSHEHDRA